MLHQLVVAVTVENEIGIRFAEPVQQVAVRVDRLFCDRAIAGAGALEIGSVAGKKIGDEPGGCRSKGPKIRPLAIRRPGSLPVVTGKTGSDRIAPTQADESRTRAVVMPWLAQARAAESAWLSEASGRASGKSSSS